MISNIRLPLAALVLLPAAALAQQSPGDFRLPPAPAPTPTSDVEGPVDGERVIPARPRPIPTATPTRRVPIVLPSAAPGPAPNAQSERESPAAAAAARRTPANREAPAAPPQVRATAVPDAVATSDGGNAGQASPDGAAPAFDPPAPPPASAMPEISSATDEGSWWDGMLAGLGLGALGLLALAGGYALRRRRLAAGAVPTIERPRVDPGLASSPAQALSLRVEALRMSRSFLNATLSYRVTVLNRSTSPLSNVAIEADLASAHGDLPIERQIAGPATELEEKHRTQRLAAGQSARFEGQVVLPLASASIIRQGQVALLVPLLRLRARAAGVEPVAKTLAVGPGASGGGARLVPFRLDEPPRSYEPLAQKAID